MLRRARNFRVFLRHSSGVAAIEIAIILPVLLIIMLAVIEYGYYFLRSYVVSNAVSNAADTLRVDPLALTQNQARAAGMGLVTFGQNGADICAQGAIARPVADNLAANMASGNCPWLPNVPSDSPGDTIIATGGYIAVAAFTPHNVFVPIFSQYIPDNIRRSAIVSYNAGRIPEECNGAGDVLQANPDGTFFCNRTFVPECDVPNKILKRDPATGGLVCEDLAKARYLQITLKRLYCKCDAVDPRPAGSPDYVNCGAPVPANPWPISLPDALRDPKFWMTCAARICREEQYPGLPPEAHPQHAPGYMTEYGGNNAGGALLPLADRTALIWCH